MPKQKDGDAGTEITSMDKAVDRRSYLKSAAVGAAGVGTAALAAPSIAHAQNRTFRLKLQSNWTGIGIESQDRATRLFVERVNRMSGGAH